MKPRKRKERVPNIFSENDRESCNRCQRNPVQGTRRHIQLGLPWPQLLQYDQHRHKNPCTDPKPSSTSRQGRPRITIRGAGLSGASGLFCYLIQSLCGIREFLCALFNQTLRRYGDVCRSQGFRRRDFDAGADAHVVYYVGEFGEAFLKSGISCIVGLAICAS